MKMSKDGRITQDGRLVASVKRMGGRAPGRLVTWMVLWSLEHEKMQTLDRFASRADALAWVQHQMRARAPRQK